MMICKANWLSNLDATSPKAMNQVILKMKATWGEVVSCPNYYYN